MKAARNSQEPKFPGTSFLLLLLVPDLTSIVRGEVGICIAGTFKVGLKAPHTVRLSISVNLQRFEQMFHSLLEKEIKKKKRVQGICRLNDVTNLWANWKNQASIPVCLKFH